MKKSGFLLFSLLVLTGLTGCLPVSRNPLSEPENAAPEPRLAGVWHGKSGADEVFLHFVQGAGAQMQIVEVDHEKKGAAHTTLYTAFPSVIDGRHYLNVRDGNGEGKPYYFVRYRFADNGALSLWLMSEKSAAQAIKSGKIKGKTEEKSGGDWDVTLTDTTERLAAFVRKSDPELLFDQKFGTFKKVTLPALDSAGSPPAKKKTPPGKKKPVKKHGKKSG